MESVYRLIITEERTKTQLYFEESESRDALEKLFEKPFDEKYILKLKSHIPEATFINFELFQLQTGDTIWRTIRQNLEPL